MKFDVVSRSPSVCQWRFVVRIYNPSIKFWILFKTLHSPRYGNSRTLEIIPQLGSDSTRCHSPNIVPSRTANIEAALLPDERTNLVFTNRLGHGWAMGIPESGQSASHLPSWLQVCLRLATSLRASADL